MSVVHNNQAVGKFQHFVKVRRNKQYRCAVVTKLNYLFADKFRCAYVNATGRLVCNDKMRTIGELTGCNNFLHITAGEHSYRRIPVIALNKEVLNKLIGQIVNLFIVKEKTLVKFFLIISVGNNIVFNAGIRSYTLGHTVFGNMGHTHLSDFAD